MIARRELPRLRPVLDLAPRPVSGRAEAGEGALPRFVVVPAVGAATWIQGSLALAAKRGLDVAGAGLLLLLSLPLLLAIAAAIRLTSPGPALFAQTRIGYRCRPFRMLKFRSMVADAERLETVLARAEGRTFLKLTRDPRITPLGRLLRRYSLDELPQLWNVLRGDMSLVGPRPLLLTDLERFPRRHQERRFAMPPGLTGLWQVSGRSDLADDERIRLDLAYVEAWSLGLDLRLLARTLPAVLGAEGAR